MKPQPLYDERWFQKETQRARLMVNLFQSGSIMDRLTAAQIYLDYGMELVTWRNNLRW